eukprot:109581-Prymnesium_polylepis.1
MNTLAWCSRVLLPKPHLGSEGIVPTGCGPIDGLSAYVPGPGLLVPRFPRKRSSLPNPHSGAELNCPLTCGPTAARITYVAGPGDRGGPPPLSAAWSCVMNTFSWSSRVLLPKPN